MKNLSITDLDTLLKMDLEGRMPLTPNQVIAIKKEIQSRLEKIDWPVIKHREGSTF